jgi:hypothetical protein
MPVDATKTPSHASSPEKGTAPSLQPGTAGAAAVPGSMAGANEAMAQAGKKLTADFKKFMGGMGNIKRS